MILAIDVQYTQLENQRDSQGNTQTTAIAAGVCFHDWPDTAVDSTMVKHLDNVAPYEPGKFYKRELPCILALLNDAQLTQATFDLNAIVIDGYVTLGSQNKPGLGLYLYDAIDRATPIIGVAKNKFVNTPSACELLRGSSQKPLFITTAGIPLDTAKAWIAQMHGHHRLPTLLKKVDHLCRGLA